MDAIFTVDLHARAVQGCVSSKTAFEDYHAGYVAADWVVANIPDKENLAIVAPDAGAIKRAKSFHQNVEWHGF